MRTQAHLNLSARLQALNLAPLLVYTVSNAPASIQPYLAWQFNIEQIAPALGIFGVSYQSVIANALTYYQQAGTPALVLSLLTLCGFSSSSLLEGQASWGGSTYPTSQGWAAFRVNLAPVNSVLTATQLAAIRTIINFAKPARCVLDALVYTPNVTFSDDETPGGAINGLNTAFTFQVGPIDTAHVLMFLGGLFLTNTVDYTLAGTNPDSLTLLAFAPTRGSIFRAYYLFDAGATGFSEDSTATSTISGALDGSNVTYGLSATPNPAASLQLFLNGALLKQGSGKDYTLSSATVTMLVAPISTDLLTAVYRTSPISVSFNWADAETPGGIIDGTNQAYTLAHAPDPPNCLQLFYNGNILTQGTDYFLTASAVTMFNAPGAGYALEAFYRY